MHLLSPTICLQDSMLSYNQYTFAVKLRYIFQYFLIYTNTILLIHVDRSARNKTVRRQHRTLMVQRLFLLLSVKFGRFQWNLFTLQDKHNISTLLMKQKLFELAMKQASEMFAKNSLFYLFLNFVQIHFILPTVYLYCRHIYTEGKKKRRVT